jgi:hypothetical protein
VAGSLFLSQTTVSADALAQDAIGDHLSCALNMPAAKAAIPLTEPPEKTDAAYRLFLSAPRDDAAAPAGPIRVVARHFCAYGGRRFAHVIVRYRGHVVSLLMTANEAAETAADTRPHLIGQPADGLSVVSVNGSHHAILLVSDIEGGELSRLFTLVAKPVVDR